MERSDWTSLFLKADEKRRRDVSKSIASLIKKIAGRQKQRQRQKIESYPDLVKAMPRGNDGRFMGTTRRDEDEHKSNFQYSRDGNTKELSKMAEHDNSPVRVHGFELIDVTLKMRLTPTSTALVRTMWGQAGMPTRR